MHALWAIGTRGQPPQRVRTIAFVNQTSLSGITVTLGFQTYYAVTDLTHFLPLILANSLFFLVYLSGFALNHAGRHTAARNWVIGTVYVQLFIVTAFISTGAGVHFFYFALAVGIALIGTCLTGMLALAAALFTLCHFAFPPGSTPLTVPPEALRVMYAASATGALLLTGLLAYLFRIEIEHAEARLTAANRELERLTGTDPLTGLANRRSLEEHLAREWARLRRHDQPLSLIVIDIDFFKRFNDHYGHIAGDDCLRRVADAIAGVSRRAGDLVARYGGEEFVVVLPDTDEHGAFSVAEQALAAIAELRIIHEHSPVSSTVTASIGAATDRPTRLASPEQLVQRADDALYAAKRAGRHRIAVWHEDRAASF